MFKASITLFIVHITLIISIGIEDLYPPKIYKFLSLLFVYTYLILLSYIMTDEDEPSDVTIDENCKKIIVNWKYYINDVVGLFCVGGAISAINTNYPRAVAITLIIFILVYAEKAKNNKLLNIRSYIEDKYTIDNEQKIILKQIKSNHMSLYHLFSDCWPFALGFLSLVFTATFVENSKPFWEFISDYFLT